MKKEEFTECSPIQIDVNDTTTHNVCFEKCENNKNLVLEPQESSNVGRFLMVNATIKNICPKKRVAVGIKLYETTNGNKVIKGHKAYSIMHDQKCCTDITLTNIHFVLPEENTIYRDKTSMCDKSDICDKRTFDLETTAHYIDLTCVKD